MNRWPDETRTETKVSMKTATKFSVVLMISAAVGSLTIAVIGLILFFTRP
jgi:hypothetical protein